MVSDTNSVSHWRQWQSHIEGRCNTRASGAGGSAKSRGCSCVCADQDQVLPSALSGVTPQHLGGFPTQFGAQKVHIKYETSRARFGTGTCCQEECVI